MNPGEILKKNAVNGFYSFEKAVVTNTPPFRLGLPARVLRPLHLPLLLLVLGMACEVAAQEEIEIKFIISAKNLKAAWNQLDEGDNKLSSQKFIAEKVCFFENETATLGKEFSLILRARRKQKGPDASTADSTVKVRLDAGATQPGPLEKLLRTEQDWTSPDNVSNSRAVDWKPSKKGAGGPGAAVFDAVMNGQKTAESLFQRPAQPSEGEKPAVPSQMELINERTQGGLNWSLLRRYGPVHAKVWDEKYKLSSDFQDVTVEEWVLQKPGKEEERLLELSVKVKVADAVEAKAMVIKFFAEAQRKFGEPEKTSKTKRVLDYYAPGVATF